MANGSQISSACPLTATLDHIIYPKAVSPVHKQWRGPADHTHQVGNDRVVAAVSNYGYVQVRQDEGSPKFLNDDPPDDALYGAGVGFLTDGKQMLSTYYPGHGESFDRILGEGYFRKIVKAHETKSIRSSSHRSEMIPFCFPW